MSVALRTGLASIVTTRAPKPPSVSVGFGGRRYGSILNRLGPLTIKKPGTLFAGHFGAGLLVSNAPAAAPTAAAAPPTPSLTKTDKLSIALGGLFTRIAQKRAEVLATMPTTTAQTVAAQTAAATPQAVAEPEAVAAGTAETPGGANRLLYLGAAVVVAWLVLRG